MGSGTSISEGGRDKPRWWARLWGRTPAPDLDPSRDDLVVVVEGLDDAEACSTTLERAAATEPRWDAAAQAVLRHHLLLPSQHVPDAVAVAAQDGYAEPPTPAPSAPDATAAALAAAHPEVTDAQVLVLQRVQLLDALHCSQERSRMAGLAQRRGGLVLGWDALQPRGTSA